MKNQERRQEIYKILMTREEPITATALAEQFGITRQVIVKDMGILKAEKKDVLSTARGYLLSPRSRGTTRQIEVCHSDSEIEDELYTIIDFGGRVLTTGIQHSVYGNIGEMLNIKCKKDIVQFMNTINEENCQPLLRLTNGKHSHMIEADDEETLDEICCALREKGYLL